MRRNIDITLGLVTSEAKAMADRVSDSIRPRKGHFWNK
jgi:hypothetical protein